MILRIDHVAIAVKNYDTACDFFTRILGAVSGAGAYDQSLKFNWQLFSLGDLSRLELLRPGESGSFLDNFLKDRDGGVHHITMQTRDIQEAKRILEENGIPFFGYNCIGDIWKELFIHPRDAFGVLIQIAEFRPDDWLAEKMKIPAGGKFLLEKSADGIILKTSPESGGTSTTRLSEQQARELIKSLEKALS